MVDKDFPLYLSLPVPAVLRNAVVLYRRTITFSNVVSTNHKSRLRIPTFQVVEVGVEVVEVLRRVEEEQVGHGVQSLGDLPEALGVLVPGEVGRPRLRTGGP